jgi:hypothetical protein
MHRDLLVNSRKGINATPEELIQASDIFYEGNKKGQSISHITYNHRDEITWSLKTSYNYYQLGLFRTKYHDLPVAPTMKKRKKNLFNIKLILNVWIEDLMRITKILLQKILTQLLLN